MLKTLLLASFFLKTKKIKFEGNYLFGNLRGKRHCSENCDDQEIYVSTFHKLKQ